MEEFGVKPVECFLNAKSAGSSIEECIVIGEIGVVMSVSPFPDRYSRIQLPGHVERGAGIVVDGDVICGWLSTVRTYFQEF